MAKQPSHSVLVGAVCVLALVAAQASSASRAGGPPTAAAYRLQANAICSSENRQVSALPSGITLAVYLTDALKIADKAFAQLKQVTPPAELSRLHARVLANIAAGFPIVSGLLGRAKAGELTLAQFEHDKALTANVAEEDALWKQLGATVCANS